MNGDELEEIIMVSELIDHDISSWKIEMKEFYCP
jgi:hypothetical protein